MDKFIIVGYILLKGNPNIWPIIDLVFLCMVRCSIVEFGIVPRYLSRLKSYVRNKVTLEGFIAEGYIVEVCLTFCSRYMHGFETIFIRPIRIVKNSTSMVSYFTLGQTELIQAHRYILFNCADVGHFRE